MNIQEGTELGTRISLEGMTVVWGKRQVLGCELSMLSPEELLHAGSSTSAGSKLGQALLLAGRSWPALTAQRPGHVIAAPGE